MGILSFNALLVQLAMCISLSPCPFRLCVCICVCSPCMSGWLTSLFKVCPKTSVHGMLHTRNLLPSRVILCVCCFASHDCFHGVVVYRMSGEMLACAKGNGCYHHRGTAATSSHLQGLSHTNKESPDFDIFESQTPSTGSIHPVGVSSTLAALANCLYM